MRYTYIALLYLTLAHPAQAADPQLRLPSWASDEGAPRMVEQAPAKPAKTTRHQRHDKKPRAVEVFADPVSPTEGAGANSVPPTEGARAVSADDTTFSALRLLRTNQAALRLCDHRAARLGQQSASRIRFRVVVDPQGQAKVDVNVKAPISAAIARCYRTLASSWRYPATGQTYTLHLSRITPNRR